MYPFGPYQQPPAQKPPFLQQVLDYLPKSSQPTYGAGPFMHAPVQQTGGLLNSITKVHKGLQIVQQVLPIWKQYAPLVKNAPMLIDMAKIMLSDDQEEEEEQENKHEQLEEMIDQNVKGDQETPKPWKSKPLKAEDKKKDPYNGLPAPKLYI